MPIHSICDPDTKSHHAVDSNNNCDTSIPNRQHHQHDDTINNNNSRHDDSDVTYRQQRHRIKEFYNGATVLVTGGTGFLGKVLIEKLLRTCGQVRCVYVLLRAKKGRSSAQRYAEFVQNPVRIII